MKTVFFRRNSTQLFALLVFISCVVFLVLLSRSQGAGGGSGLGVLVGSRGDAAEDERPGEGQEGGKLSCTFSNPHDAIITTPNKILLYNLVTRTVVRTIHEGRGLYYGAFLGPENKPDAGHGDNEGSRTRRRAECSPTLVVNTRPQDKSGNDEASGDAILQIDLNSGAIVETVPTPYTKFTHDMVKSGDKVFIADTGHGLIHVLDYPALEEVGTLKMFTPRDHINNLGVSGNLLFVMMHSRGQSSLARVDLATESTSIFSGIGSQAHQTMLLSPSRVLFLDSGNAALKMADLEEMLVYTLGSFAFSNEPKKFLKGLLVREKKAYIGMTNAGSREWRRDVTNDAEVVEFCLEKFVILSRTRIDSDGITNMILQPMWQHNTGYLAMTTPADLPLTPEIRAAATKLTLSTRQGPPGEGGPGVALMPAPEPLPQGAKQSPRISKVVVNDAHIDFDLAKDIDDTNIVGGNWPSGMKFIDLHWKNLRQGLSEKVDRIEDTQLIMGDVGDRYLPLKKKIQELTDEEWEYKGQKGNAFLSNRDGVMEQFKPGVRDLKFVFSDIMATKSYFFPLFFRFEKELQPLLDFVLGPNMTNFVGRMQLARMANGAEIKRHVDSGGWPGKMHRIHIPIILPEGTRFMISTRADGFQPIKLKEGQVFEINNRVPHYVVNPDSPRVHLVIDVAETEFAPHWFLPGQTCKYARDIVCSEPTVSRAEAYNAWLKATQTGV